VPRVQLAPSPLRATRDRHEARERTRDRTFRRRLGEVLVDRGVLDETTLDELLEEQADDRARRLQHRRLGQLIVEHGLATEAEVADALGELLDLEVVDLAVTPVDPEAARSVPRQLCEKHGVLVLGPGEHGLRVATIDPTNVLALDDVRIHTRQRWLEVVVAVPSQLRDYLARVWSLASDATNALELLEDVGTDRGRDGSAAGTGGDWSTQRSIEDIDVDDSPTVRVVDALLADAVRQGASDVHVEPQRDGVHIRYRIDGLLRDIMTLPRAAGPATTSRLKIVSNLDIAERRLPQDGRARIGVDGRVVDARVSTLPAMHGEKVVVRLLAAADEITDLTDIGLDDGQLALVQRALGTPQGLVLITGPTGSGKTSTLYSAIHEVVTPERNVVTLEDPVEIQLPGITQVQVNARSGLTFARGLRAVLRQDPDVVLVGEIRDDETAELALRASLTGHLVLSTLHTTSALAALTRLVDMGAPAYLVASSLSLVVAQRLVRRPCPSCAEPYQPDAEVQRLLGLTAQDIPEVGPVRGTGCPSCSETGHRGRTGVFEVLDVDARIRRALVADPTEATLSRVLDARGHRALRSAAVAAAARGETTYEEALRVTQADVDDALA
jgi:type II secretory ATPase GspE/PulE/Tfp pilus assembly ATPase PilB-like protein